eukprot:g633.t1
MDPESRRFLRVLAIVLVLLSGVAVLVKAFSPQLDPSDVARHMQLLQSLDLCISTVPPGLGSAGTAAIALGILVLAMTAWICRRISQRARGERAECAGLLFVSFALSSLGDAAEGDGTGVTGFIASFGYPHDSTDLIQKVAAALGFAAGARLAAFVVALLAVKGWPKEHKWQWRETVPLLMLGWAFSELAAAVGGFGTVYLMAPCRDGDAAWRTRLCIIAVLDFLAWHFAARALVHNVRTAGPHNSAKAAFCAVASMPWLAAFSSNIATAIGSSWREEYMERFSSNIVVQPLSVAQAILLCLCYFIVGVGLFRQARKQWCSIFDAKFAFWSSASLVALGLSTAFLYLLLEELHVITAASPEISLSFFVVVFAALVAAMLVLLRAAWWSRGRSQTRREVLELLLLGWWSASVFTAVCGCGTVVFLNSFTVVAKAGQYRFLETLLLPDISTVGIVSGVAWLVGTVFAARATVVVAAADTENPLDFDDTSGTAAGDAQADIEMASGDSYSSENQHIGRSQSALLASGAAAQQPVVL